jgi:hypothetical protein
LKISAYRRIIDVNGGILEYRSAETGCAKRILARPNGVAEQQTPALFRQVSFPTARNG